jgi:D-alanine-D-alanine ligase
MFSMKNIAILAGGFDAERVISLKSAQVVKRSLNSNHYLAYIIDIDKDLWRSEEGYVIDKNDFSLQTPTGKISFDACFMAIHGSPVEDGKIQGYLEMMGVPYTGCDGRTMAITMDKILSKQILKNTFGVRTAAFEIYRRGEEFQESKYDYLGFPMFIKPNSVGSSFGVTKVKERSQIKKAIEDALEHDDLILIEEFIEGREFSHGILQEGDKLHIMPITEIISETEFFDYAAKYEGKSKEVTPAENLSPKVENEMRVMSEKIFRVMNCRGLGRVDYLLRGDEVFFMEINTIPGLSEASIFPQQLNHYGFSLEQAFAIILETCLSDKF